MDTTDQAGPPGPISTRLERDQLAEVIEAAQRMRKALGEMELGYSLRLDDSDVLSPHQLLLEMRSICEMGAHALRRFDHHVARATREGDEG